MTKTITVEIQSTIEIPEVPEGKKLVFRDGKFSVEDITPVLPETWEEFCELYPQMDKEYYIAIDNNIICCGGRRVADTDKNMLTSREDAEAHLAYIQLHRLRDCYRQGWIPDWTNKESTKYCIYFCGNCNDYIISPCRQISHFLAFQSYELAEKFLKCFRNFIVQAGDLL